MIPWKADVTTLRRRASTQLLRHRAFETPPFHGSDRCDKSAGVGTSVVANATDRVPVIAGMSRALDEGHGYELLNRLPFHRA